MGSRAVGPALARRREPSAIAPPTHAAAPAAQAVGTALPGAAELSARFTKVSF